ncbi:MAG: hypothetical protein Crog4KO_23340 [Crocinitomicaceae bacterium]
MFAPKQPNKAGHHPSKNKSQEKKPFVLQRQGLNAGIQEKLKVGQTNDRFEKEADSVADKVVSNTEAPKVETAPTPPIQTMKVGSGDLTQRVLREPQHTESDISTSIEVQKESQADVETEVQLSEKLATSSASAPKSEVQLKEEEEVQLDKIDEQNTSKAEVEPVETEAQLKVETEVQTKSEPAPVQAKAEDAPVQKKELTPEPPKPIIAPPVQLKTETPAEEEVQMKEDEEMSEEAQSVQMKSKDIAAGEDVSSQIASSKGGGSSMDDNIKSDMESGFGHDFSNVRIHTDSQAANMSTSLGAKAFTTGNDIYFNDGEYRPDTKDGKHLLAHELTHTLQQGTGGSGRAQRKVDPDIQTIEENEKQLFIKADSLTDIYFSETLLNYFNSHFFNKYSHVYSQYRDNDEIRISGTIQVEGNKHRATFFYDPIFKSYRVELRSESKEAKDREVDSREVRNWLTPQGKVEFEALNAHFKMKNPIEWSQLYAPLGMIILLKRNKLYYLIDNKNQFAISYSDYMEYYRMFKYTEGTIYLKLHALKSGKFMRAEAQKIIVAPDHRFVTIREESEAEMNPNEPEELINERFSRSHLIAGGAEITTNKYRNLQKLENARKKKLDWDAGRIILTMHQFNDYEIGWFKKHERLKHYVKKQLSAEEMAWAITPFKPSIMELWQKLGLIRGASLDGQVDTEAIRPILQQYKKSRPYNSILERSGYGGHRNISISHLKSQIKKHTSEEKYDFVVGKYDDTRDTSTGIVGLNQESVQDELHTMALLAPAYFAHKKENWTLFNEKLHEVEHITHIHSHDAFDDWLDKVEPWFIHFFEDNAQKMAFTVLQITEEALKTEMENYQYGKVLQLERDFVAYKDVLETGVKMFGKLYGGSTDRGTASHWLKNPPAELKELVTTKHPYLLDIDHNKEGYNWVTQLISIYLRYKEKPGSFHYWFKVKMHESIGEHLRYVYETKGNLRDDPEFVWDLEEIIQLTTNYLNFGEDSMYYDLVQQKIKDDASSEFWTNIGLAAGAVVLGVISAGLGAGVIAGVAGVSTATVTTGAAIGGIAISTADVYYNYQDYNRRHAAANINSHNSPLVGLTNNDPSITWLVISIAGLGLDLGGALKAFKLLGPAAKSLDEGADSLKAFDDILEELTETHKVLNKASADKLAAKAKAQKEFSQSIFELNKVTFGKVGMNRFLDPEFIGAFSRVVMKGLSTGVSTFDELLHQIVSKQKLKNITKDINYANLTDEQRVILVGYYDHIVGQKRIFRETGEMLPLGFNSVEEYDNFVKTFKKSSPEGVEGFFQGSSVIGVKHDTGAFFDLGRNSDYDIALTGSDLFDRAKKLGLKAKDGSRIGPLDENTIRILGLSDLQNKLASSAGREVNFMIYSSTEPIYFSGEALIIH